MSKKTPLANDEIVELGKKIFEIIKVWLDSDEGWTFSEETHDVRMYKRHIPAVPGVHEKGTVIKGVGFVAHATVADFVDLVLDQEKRKAWDTADFYDVISTIDAETDVCHVGVPSYGPVSARDFVSVRRSIFDKQEDSYTAVQVSIEHTLTGREHMIKKHVRGTLLPSCWRFVQMEGGCMTYYVSGVHLGGWLPQSIVDSFVYSNTHSAFFPNVRKCFLKAHEAKVGSSTESDKKHSHKKSKHSHHDKHGEEEEVAKEVEQIAIDGEPHKLKKKKSKVLEEEITDD
jgi:hypothetical protein